MVRKKLKVLSAQEYGLIESKDPLGIYDHETREALYWVIEKLRQGKKESTWFEGRLYNKFRRANFGLLVNKDSESEGAINFQGTVRIEGRFEGQVKVDGTLVVTESGSVVGNIETETLICQGKIRGSVEASRKVEISCNASVEGDILTPSFQIDRGARFEGRCRMTPHPEKRDAKHPLLPFRSQRRI